MTKFIGESGGNDVPLRSATLQGDGWRIEIRPTEDGLGLSVYASGSGSGENRLIIVPRVSNVVELRNDQAREELAHKEAVRLVEVEKTNRKSRRKSG